MELVLAQLQHGPEGDLVLVGDIGGVLLGEDVGIGACAGSAAVDVDQRLGTEQAVDIAGLGGHRGGYGGLLGIAGGAQQVRSNTQQGQAQLHIFHRRGDVGGGNDGRLDLVVGDVYLLSGIGAAGGQQLYHQMLTAVIGVVVGAGHIGCAGAASRLNDQRRIIDGFDRQQYLVIRHRHVRGSRRFLCGADVEDVAEDDRLAGEQFEVRIHEFAERVGSPVIGITQLLHSLGPAGAKDRSAGGGRLVCHLNRSQADYEGNAGLRHDRGTDAGCQLRNIYAVVH